MAILGLDHLGLGHKKYPVQTVIDLAPSGSALGCFDNTFGNAVPAIRKCLQSGKFPLFRVQIWWSTAHKIVPIIHVG